MQVRTGAAARIRVVGQWFGRHPRLTFYGLSLLLHLAFAPFFIHDWDGYVFVETARDFIHGQSPYQTVEMEPSHVYVGDGVPVVNSWYAYPPVALLLIAPSFAIFTAFSGAPWVERVAIKMPMMLGDLLLAFIAAGLVRHVLQSRGDARAMDRARAVELFLLFNPFLIFVSAVWGMFDAWIFVFFLAGFWLLVTGSPFLAGGAFALSGLVKPFPAFVAPVVFIYAFHHVGRARFFRFLGGGVATFFAVCLPFFATAPRGFIQQVLLNHTNRPPQGFTVVGAPVTFTWLREMTGIHFLNSATSEEVGAVSFILLLLIVTLLALRARHTQDVETAIHLSLVGIVATLLASKVVNEQYFLMPIVLAAVAFALSRRPIHQWLARAYSAGALVSAAFLGWHFVTFIPPDVASRVFPFDPLEAVPRIVRWLGWNDYQAYVYPTIIGVVCLLPAWILSLRIVFSELTEPARRVIARLPLRRGAPVLTVLVVAVMVIAPVGAGVWSARITEEMPSTFTPLSVDGPLVGAYYYMWWHNPAHDPAIEYGNWIKGVSQVPSEGYYTVSSGKLQSDFRTMKANGIDLVVFSYHEYDRPKLPAISRIAYENGLVVAPLIELGEIYERTDHQSRDENNNSLGADRGFSLRDGTRQAIVSMASSALYEMASSPSVWRVDGKPVVAFYDSYFAFIDQHGPVRERMVEAAWQLAQNDTAERAMPPVNRSTLEAVYPRDEASFLSGQPYAALWRRAYDEVFSDFWDGVREDLEKRHGPLYFLGGENWDLNQGSHRGVARAIADGKDFDTSTIYAPSFIWVFGKGDSYEQNYARWLAQHTVKAQHDRAASRLVVTSVSPAYDDRPLRGSSGFEIPAFYEGNATYDRMWGDAIAMGSDVVMVATWNEFYEGTGIEPTRESGSRDLEKTAEWSARLKALESKNASDRVLVVTNFKGAASEPGVQDPDWTHALSVSLQLTASRLWGSRVEAVDWNGPSIGSVALENYSLVVVEPGPGKPASLDAENFVDTLSTYIANGGHVVLLGSHVEESFAKLIEWSEESILTGTLVLETDDGEVLINPNDRARVHNVPADAEVYLWMHNETARVPAAWAVTVGNGTLAVTAFKPQGSTPTDEAGLRLNMVTARWVGAGAGNE